MLSQPHWAEDYVLVSQNRTPADHFPASLYSPPWCLFPPTPPWIHIRYIFSCKSVISLVNVPHSYGLNFHPPFEMTPKYLHLHPIHSHASARYPLPLENNSGMSSAYLKLKSSSPHGLSAVFISTVPTRSYCSLKATPGSLWLLPLVCIQPSTSSFGFNPVISQSPLFPSLYPDSGHHHHMSGLL